MSALLAEEAATGCWPTEAHERAKQRLKERQEALRAAGLDPKLAKKRKAKLQEQHFDDCGSDVGPLEKRMLAKKFCSRFAIAHQKLLSSCSGRRFTIARPRVNMLRIICTRRGYSITIGEPTTC